jgi:hypothetical protein
MKTLVYITEHLVYCIISILVYCFSLSLSVSLSPSPIMNVTSQKQTLCFVTMLSPHLKPVTGTQ